MAGEHPRGPDQPQVAEHAQREHRWQQGQREQVEAVAQLIGLSHEGDGDDHVDKVRRYKVERPLASAMVPMRAVWRLNRSVVNADSAGWRASGSVGWSMASPSPA